VGCADSEDVADTQRTNIERFLTSSHVPRLINVDEVENSLERNPAFYERIDYSVYRYIATYYDEGRESKPAIKQGDEVTITFTAYVFTGSTPSLAAVYMSNDQSVINALGQAGLNTDYWEAEPLTIKIGQTNIIKGVTTSLIGCREGDVVEAYMTLDAAYDDKVVGVVPKNSSVAWFYTIDSVNGAQ
jgi:hypothetical protein